MTVWLFGETVLKGKINMNWWEKFKSLLNRTKGIKETYPLLPFPLKIKGYMRLVRPFTLLGAWISGFFLDILFLKPNSDILHAFFIGSVLALLQAGGQTLNQAIHEEVEIDKINKKMRPTVVGTISLIEAKVASFLLFLSGISLAFHLNLTYGLFSMLIAFFAVAYTAPPFRMKKRFFLNNLWQGVARGLLPAIYVASVHGQYASLATLYGIVLAIWVTGLQGSKDFGDEVGDKKFNIKTFPVVLGRRRALKLMTILMLLSFWCMNLFIYFQLLPSSFLVLNVLTIPSILVIYSLLKQIKFKYAENNLGWVGFYGTLGLFYILPSFLV